MCGVVEAAIGIGLASAGVNIGTQAAAAGEQNAYRKRLGISQKQAYKENAAAVIKDVGFQVDQLARRNIEQAAATETELQGIMRNVREATATSRTQVAAQGIEGRSIDFLHAQFERDVADFESTAMRNMKMMTNQSNAEAMAIYARGQTAINSGYPNPLPPAQTVNPLAGIMNGISTGLAVFGALRSFGAPDGIGAASNASTVNDPRAPWYLQANPGPGTFGTPPLLQAAPVSLSAPALLSL